MLPQTHTPDIYFIFEYINALLLM